MEDNFVKIDLHIHTPSSSCYKGEKSDDEYLRILRKAKDEALSGKTCPRCGTTMERASTNTSIPGMYKWACPKCGYVIHVDK